MPREPVWRNKIEQILKDKSLTYQTLFKDAKILVREDANKENKEKSLTKRPDRDFNKALVQLLDNGDVTILPKYDIGVHRYTKEDKKGESKPINEIQSLKIEGFGFELVKKEQYEIFELLSSLNRLGDPNEDIKKTINTLQNAFTRKIEQYKTLKKEYWKFLLSKVEVISLKESIKEIEHKFEEYGEPMELQPMTGKQAGRYVGGPPEGATLKKELEILQGWYEEDKNAKLWYVNTSLEDLDPLFGKTTYQQEEERLKALGLTHEEAIKERCKSIVHRPSVMWGKVQEQAYTPTELFERTDMVNSKLIEVNGKWVGMDSNLIPTPENFLIKKLGIEKPPERDEKEISKMFRIILFNIMSSENYQVLQNSLAWALSGEEDSLEWFELFIEGMSDVTTLKTKLSEEINNPDHINFWMDGIGN